MTSWNRKQTILLIKLYKKCPNLYDKRNKGYLNRAVRDRTLLLITARLRKVRPKTTPNDVKQKIRTLRQQFFKELNKNTVSKQNKEFYTPKLWCYDYLKFFDIEMPLNGIENQSTRNLAEEEKMYGSTSNLNIGQDICELDSKQWHNTLLEDNIDCSTDGVDDDLRNNLLETTTHILEALTKKINAKKNPKNNALATFISAELDAIEDQNALEDTKWGIQMVVNNALKRQRYKTNKMP